MKTIPRLLAVLSAFVVTSVPCASAFAEEALGRLFFTPERRQTLDRQRQFNIQEKHEVPEEPTFTIDGVVTRSSGKQTVWINGVAQDGVRTDNGLAVTLNHKNPGKVILQPDGGPDAKASVGDTVNRSTGEAADLLGSGTLKVRPATR